MSLRILSIDGGGIRGIVAARMLEAIAQQLDRPLSQYFDLITGTSTGALIAAGLMVGKSPTELVNLYLHRGTKIFPYRSWVSPQRLPLILKYGLSAPKFSDRGLIETVRSLGLDMPLAEVAAASDRLAKLMIVSYDTIRRSPVFFKSWRLDEWYTSVPLWQACVCSAAAPTYFPAQRLQVTTDRQALEFSMIDGGVGANNPTACAVAEAVRLLRSRAINSPRATPSMDSIVDQISVLSLGTGALAQALPWQEINGWGALQWAPRIVDVVMEAPADIHRYIAEQIVTPAEPMAAPAYLRLQPTLDQKFGAIDNANPEYLLQLLAQTDAYVATQIPAIKTFFAPTVQYSERSALRSRR